MTRANPSPAVDLSTQNHCRLIHGGGPRCIWSIVASAALYAGALSNPAALFAGEQAQQAHDEFQAERMKLGQEKRALFERFRSRPAKELGEAMQTWRRDNHRRLQALQEQAQAIRQLNGSPELPVFSEIEIPEDASIELEEFLVKRAELHNERARLLNELRDATDEVRANALRQWDEQNRERRIELQEMARLIPRAAATRLSLPERPAIPADASPTLKDYLLQRHELAQERAAEENRIRNLPPAQQNAARRAWQERNAARQADLRERAQRVSRELQSHRSSTQE